MKRTVLLAVLLAAAWVAVRRREDISRCLRTRSETTGGSGVADVLDGGADAAANPAAPVASGARVRGPGNERATDVTAVITVQHQRVRELLEQVRLETGPARADAFHALRLLLALHETAEEQAIHPQVLRQLGPYDRAANDRVAEEQTAGQTIRSLELVDVDSDQFDATFDGFAASVIEHAAAEETDEWPTLRQITDPPVIEAMTEQMRAVPLLAADPSAPGADVSFAGMQDWARSRLPAPPAS